VSGVPPASSTTTVSPARPRAAAPAAGEPGAALLPDPSAAALAASDPLSLLYLFESKDQQLGVDQGTQKVAALQTERHQALDQELKAIQQAVDASNHHSFWDSLGSVFSEVAKVAAVVASVAAAVATCGAATPLAALAIAGAVLSSAAFVDGEAHVLQKLGVKGATAGWIDAGMSIAGGLTSFGVGSLATAANAASPALSIVSRGGAVVGGIGQIGAGASAIGVGQAQASADQAAADEVVAQVLADHAQRQIQIAIEDTQSSDAQSKQAMDTIANTKAIQNATAEFATAAVKG